MKQNIKEIVEAYALAINSEQEELLETLGKIPAPSLHEEKRAEFCKDWFLKQGAKNVHIDCAKNVICQIDCDKYDDIIVFAAHTDVVFPDTDILNMHKIDRKLYAPGIGDDTANLVNLMMGCKYILDNNVKPNIGMMFVANSGEEGIGDLIGVKELFKTYGNRIKYFYSFDGYMSQCCSKAVGSYRYKIKAKTNGGHSYLNFGEPSAIEILCKLVEKLYSAKLPTEEKTTYNVGYIEGGTTVNTIAQDAHMLYEFRSSSQQCLKYMEKYFYETIKLIESSNIQIDVEVIGIRPGNGDLPQKELQDFTQKSSNIISKYFDGEIDFDSYSTDSNIPLSLGIIANTIGTIKGGSAHTREEWVDLDSLPAGLKIALTLMLEHTHLAE